MRARAAVVVTVVASLTFAGLATSARRGAAVPSPALAFADGKWQGTVVYSASVSFGSGVTSSGSLQSGSFDLTVDGGKITSGTFTASGAGGDVVPGGSAHVDAHFSGTMAGSSAQPVMHGQSATFTGSANVSGLQVPINISLGPGDLTPIPFQIVSATCGVVSGRFDQTLRNAVQSAGGTVNSVIAHFSAVRTGSAKGPASTLSDLMDKAQSIANNFASTGTLDVDGLITVVEQSEVFSASLGTSTKCGLVTTAGSFNQVLTSIVADLLKLGVEHADKLSTYQLWELSAMAVRVGAIGDGALDSTFSNQMLSQLDSVLGARLDAAISGHDANTIEMIRYAASALGLKDLVGKAEAAK